MYICTSLSLSLSLSLLCVSLSLSFIYTITCNTFCISQPEQLLFGGERLTSSRSLSA